MSTTSKTISWLIGENPSPLLVQVDDPQELVTLAQADPAFHALNERFQSAGITSWLYEPEKAIHYGIAAFAPGNGVIVEIGTFEGASAMFSAGGLARRGHGRLISVDPHLGGPPWLGMAPHQRTLTKFRKNAVYCELDSLVESRIGDSCAVASVWHGEPIAATFIDADHSYLGALKDFEVWGSKLLPGGLALFDDVDDPCLPELLELLEDLKTFRSVKFLGNILGVGIFRREPTPIGHFLGEISELAHRRKIYRAWNMAGVHDLNVPTGYARSPIPDERGFPDAYQLGFLAKCPTGNYGYTSRSPERETRLVEAICRDRGDGEFLELRRDSAASFRVITCLPDELKTYAPKLLPGGVGLVRNGGSLDPDETLRVRKQLLDVGLDGCGWGGAIHWGVWYPHDISADTVLRRTYEAYKAA